MHALRFTRSVATAAMAAAGRHHLSRCPVAVAASRVTPSVTHFGTTRTFGTTASALSSHPASPSASPGSSGSPASKVSLLTLRKLHKNKKRISVMTAVDYPSGLLVDKSPIDMCLVGDSLAMVALGYPSTNEVGMDEMIYHCKAVSRGVHRAFKVGDMPFGSYEACPVTAVANAVRFVREGSMEAVKLEGGRSVAPSIRAIVNAGIPVLGHIGLTPQRASSLGGFRVQGKTAKEAKELLADALAIQAAGCFGIVLEAIPAPVAKIITEALSIPTIGIGAGPECSGQVLVMNDMLGIYDKFVPKFCKQYASIGQDIQKALADYHNEVRDGSFPHPEEHTYPAKDSEMAVFASWAAAKKQQQQAETNTTTTSTTAHENHGAGEDSH
ncbi:hypothetical protein GQ42DRAFT_162447 [Ramicandelaber brevisporus]|nr:hypothetical protein GQ42DRAFT_162447 [Ramicandelaber brevisporus]